MSPLPGKDYSAALGLGVAHADFSVEFTWVAQRHAAIWAVAVTPSLADVIDSVGLTIVTHAPERAKVQHTEDGFTISDMGIRRVTYAMKASLEGPHMYRSPVPTDEDVRRGHAGPNWFAKADLGYVRAGVGDHVVVHVHNQSKENVEVNAVILYREVPPIRCARCADSGVLAYATSGNEPYAASFCDCPAGQARR